MAGDEPGAHEQPNGDAPHREMRAAPDDFFESGYKSRTKWVIAAFAVLTIVVVALPLISEFTDWL